MIKVVNMQEGNMHYRFMVDMFKKAAGFSGKAAILALFCAAAPAMAMQSQEKKPEFNEVSKMLDELMPKGMMENIQCKQYYDDIFRNINSNAADKRPISDEEISWALAYEKAKNAGQPCPSMAGLPGSKPGFFLDSLSKNPTPKNSGKTATAPKAPATPAAPDQTTPAQSEFQQTMGKSYRAMGLSSLKLGNKKEAREEFGESCKYMDGFGCKLLAEMLWKGEGGAQNQAHAVTIWNKACHLKDGAACRESGLSYFRGEAVPKDDIRARHYAQKSCDLNNADGCFLYGGMLANGVGGNLHWQGGYDALDKSCRLGRPDGCTLRDEVKKQIDAVNAILKK